MRIISTKAHGVLDYLMGTILIASPWIFDFVGSHMGRSAPIFLGVVLLLMSLLTNYEAGVIRKISMRAHLVVDFFAGLFLAFSPWILHFSEEVLLPHLVMGMLIMCIALMTKKFPAYMVGPAKNNGRS